MKNKLFYSLAAAESEDSLKNVLLHKREVKSESDLGKIREMVDNILSIIAFENCKDNENDIGEEIQRLKHELALSLQSYV